MDATATAALAQAASDLHAQARQHKRASAHHRHEARRLMQRADELRQVCAELGITVVFTTGTDPEGTQPQP